LPELPKPPSALSVSLKLSTSSNSPPTYGKNTTKEEIKKIRDEFKSDEYILNIIISGNGNFKNDLKNFLTQ